jgi:thiol-disulfide isomerase/thioredoxin
MRKLLLLALLLLALPPTSTGSAATDELRPFVRGSWNEIRQAHAGQATVVHFWGLTCGPCRVEMPNWGKLLLERHDLNLVVINADLVPNEAGAVSTMIAQTGLAAAENWTFKDDFVERLRYEIDPRWQGDIPRTLLIARDGTTTVIEGVADLENVREWLDGQRTSKGVSR